MPHDHSSAGMWLPLAVVALVMLVRGRQVGRERPFRPGWNLAVPVLFVAIVVATLVAHPPTAMGWVGFALGLVFGLPLGWQRARFTHIGHDPVTGALTIRQSAAAMMLLVVVVVARQATRAWMIEAGAQGLWVDAVSLALLGFAAASIVAFRGELAWRARRLVAAR